MVKYTEEQVQKILDAMKREYGFVPLVGEVLAERPDLFVPHAGIVKAAIEGDEQRLERKTAYLCAVSAATALAGEHCIDVQMKHAIQAGATKDEILEAMMIGSVMAMTRSQSYAFRKYKENFKD